MSPQSTIACVECSLVSTESIDTNEHSTHARGSDTESEW